MISKYAINEFKNYDRGPTKQPTIRPNDLPTDGHEGSLGSYTSNNYIIKGEDLSCSYRSTCYLYSCYLK